LPVLNIFLNVKNKKRIKGNPIFIVCYRIK
jgi:hypothetical protein